VKIPWLASAIAKFSQQPTKTLLAEKQPAPTKSLSARRSTSDRLAASFKLQNEAMSPRLLRRSLQAMQAVIEPSISETEGG
jgi:malonyl-CoA decarboxylase